MTRLENEEAFVAVLKDSLLERGVEGAEFLTLNEVVWLCHRLSEAPVRTVWQQRSGFRIYRVRELRGGGFVSETTTEATVAAAHHPAEVQWQRICSYTGPEYDVVREVVEKLVRSGHSVSVVGGIP